jgi:RND superfamily putative drug exporter
VLVGGFQATSLDFNRYLYGNFPRTVIFILIATYLLLLLMFRSLLLPLKAILMNVLSVAAAYGLLVFAFQWGHLQGVLHFTSSGVIDSTIPIVLFCMLFGLSMDYEVFLLSRIREEWLRTADNTQAVAFGLEKTAGVITNAAVLFVIVTGSVTFSSLILTQESGFGLTVSILVDATIIRTLLVPATMRLLGRWNWWLPGLPLSQQRKAGAAPAA